MPDPVEEKKIKEVQKAVKVEVQKLAKTAKKQAGQAKELAKQKADLAKVKEQGPADKKLAKVIDLRLKAIEVVCDSEAKATAKRINGLLKTNVPADKDALSSWEKGMDKWYVVMLKKEAGRAIGGGARVNGNISIKDRKVGITFTWTK